MLNIVGDRVGTVCESSPLCTAFLQLHTGNFLSVIFLNMEEWWVVRYRVAVEPVRVRVGKSVPVTT